MFANNNLEPNENNSSNDLFENDFVGNHFMYHHSKSILKKAAEIICIDKLHTPAFQQAILTINIDFKSQAKISVISAFLSGVIGVILAYNEAGVWSLSIQMISAAFFRMLLLWWYIKWLPTKSFSKRSFEELFSFGSKLLLANIVVTVGNNITTLIIGKKFAQKQLGFYNRA